MSTVIKDKKERKSRTDKGAKRTAYKFNTPAAYNSTRLLSNRLSIRFDLTLEEFNEIQSRSCCLCGGRGGNIFLNDQSEGFTPENSTSCCDKCEDLVKGWMKGKNGGWEGMVRHFLKVVKYKNIK